MAHGVDIRKLDVYNNCAEAFQAFDTFTAPVKLSVLDQLTTKAFHHPAFALLKKSSMEPLLSQYAENSKMSYGLISFSAMVPIATVETIVHNSLKLSQKVMNSINPEEKSRLWNSVCLQPDTYIENKTIHVLEKFISSNNFKSSSFKDHPMHKLYEEYQKLLPHRHPESCPCHKHISEQEAASTTSSSALGQPASSTASYAKTPHFKNPYFPQPVTWPLENGATLGICFHPDWEAKPLLFTSNDNKIWDVEFPIGEEFKYVIVKDGKAQYEGGPNRCFFNLDDALRSRPEDERPRF